jgi:hypothetical protein
LLLVKERVLTNTVNSGERTGKSIKRLVIQDGTRVIYILETQEMMDLRLWKVNGEKSKTVK